ncbi:hypothetical protein ACH4SK_03615 [Streptomyces inhibens]|uniref:hypothetical protein n=1 Tax=Streptomyces inhibens TaxID=2293571 RepID=UPI0037975E5E
MATDIRKRIPHVIGASFLAVTLTGTVGAIGAMSAEAGPQAKATSSSPEVICQTRVVNGKVVTSPPGCRLPRSGSTTATTTSTTTSSSGGRTGVTLDGGLTAVTTIGGGGKANGVTLDGGLTAVTTMSGGATSTGSTTGGTTGTTGTTSTGFATGAG